MVQLKPARQTIGFILVHATQEKKEELNIGYLLAQQYWHQGFAGEMLLALLHYYRDQQNVRALYAGVGASNTASVRLLEKCGFSRVSGTSGENLFYRLNLEENSA
ncbi:GNAT family N-acetyltransferase [Thalassomonas viridans]|uniref:GNAT family N-acetyltransferase n=1 Tax=Thalassomonas viridans TaxID=137584 RepID=A0AAF0CDE3_9GAMM|nr:GNAT family N-acetyltransferase [Thalassomonas viridans]WDE08039.1 GNAT family N-acetyltransferase [Thalassomonas viridans]